MGSLEDPVLAHLGKKDPTMPIAVIGMSFHGPGDANNVENFYNLLVERRETWSKVPEHKWNGDAFYHPDPMHGGTVRSALLVILMRCRWRLRFAVACRRRPLPEN